MQISDNTERLFLIVAVKTSKREQPKTVYLTVKLNVIIPKSSTPYKWATLLKEENKNTWVSITFEDVWARAKVHGQLLAGMRYFQKALH